MESVVGSFVIVSCFPLGFIRMTPGVERSIPADEQMAALARHAQCDWGDVCREDWDENDFSLREGFRLLSSYSSCDDLKFWIITEADRSLTTLLLPEEY